MRVLLTIGILHNEGEQVLMKENIYIKRLRIFTKDNNKWVQRITEARLHPDLTI